MKFDEFINKLIKEFDKELPGFDSQIKLIPKSRKKLNYHTKVKEAKKSAVLILLYPENGHIYIPFIKRVNDGSRHSGQIAFPGGKFEMKDKNLRSTALREAEEEIGTDQKKIKILKELTPLYIPVSNYIVQPVVGITKQKPIFIKNKNEVDSIFNININELSEAYIDCKKFTVRNISIAAPFFVLKEVEIWGATAMILNEFIDILKNIYKN